MAEYTIKDFECSDDLSQYTESLLFDSGEIIASMTVEFPNGNAVDVELAVRGDVRIRLADSDEVYARHTEDYSPELREAIEKGDWDNLDIGNNNWFELLYTLKDADGNYIISDGDVYEEDVHDKTPDALKELMADCAVDFAQHYDTSRYKEEKDLEL